MRRIALYGGSFNCIHVGHVLTISYLLTQGFDQIFVLPSASHPDGKSLISFNHRIKMCELACWQFNSYDDDKVQVRTTESEISPPNFSYKTVERIVDNWNLESLRDANFNFILGSDLIDDFETWENVDVIKKLATPVFIGRAGYSHEKAGPAIVPEVSSTEIRKLLKEERGCKRLEQLVPKNVLEYIKENDLYI